jgi:hypothetical protein
MSRLDIRGPHPADIEAAVSMILVPVIAVSDPTPTGGDWLVARRLRILAFFEVYS